MFSRPGRRPVLIEHPHPLLPVPVLWYPDHILVIILLLRNLYQAVADQLAQKGARRRHVATPTLFGCPAHACFIC